MKFKELVFCHFLLIMFEVVWHVDGNFSFLLRCLECHVGMLPPPLTPRVKSSRLVISSSDPYPSAYFWMPRAWRKSQPHVKCWGFLSSVGGRSGSAFHGNLWSWSCLSKTVGNGCIPGEFPNCCATGACGGAYPSSCQNLLTLSVFAKALGEWLCLRNDSSLQVRQGGNFLLWGSHSGFRGEL